MEERSKMNWIISDTHFGHANIIKYCNRPFTNVTTMNATLIRNWKALVKNDDTIWHLGDVFEVSFNNHSVRIEAYMLTEVILSDKDITIGKIIFSRIEGDYTIISCKLNKKGEKIVNEIEKNNNTSFDVEYS